MLTRLRVTRKFAAHRMSRARISHFLPVGSVEKAMEFPLLSESHSSLCPMGRKVIKERPQASSKFSPLQQFPRNEYFCQRQNDDYNLVGHCSCSCYHPPFGDGGCWHRHFPQHRNSSVKRLHVRSHRRSHRAIFLNRTHGRSKFVAGRDRRGK